MRSLRKPTFERKTPDQLKLMRRAGLVVDEVLRTLAAEVRPGISTRELDQIGREILAARGASSNFLGYGADWGIQPFPGVACISVNEEVVHGIPGDRVLAEGDIVSCDFGAVIEGWHGDAARTFLVGEVSDEVRELSRVGEEAMWAGIGATRVGARIGDISAAVEASTSSHRRRYGIIRDFTGHGIGSEMHMYPDVPNHGRGGRGPVLNEGHAIAIEPMVTLGSGDVAELEDDWTIVTRDSSWAAHWENTVTPTATGVWVLTLEDGGEAELTKRGIPFGPLAD
ncbi:type I methionyl aminopeptidase [Aestuariimicrobium sp. T2.26MG-19.2B]|uniref:type I methionyl aminopeptidase n=1 Tax=Aestuariimicrobium sp. T2.26MG-19.2B TaxID=3040679 RepID=UPI002477A503|nr:type I methionyl aminopeptidase [Aestuariimicrobium sp. T2.26MG-19.2B]CAI9406639.1 Methionine aminopeptidase 1 [Aestuariimicrobium sp. T2.26MG-19.2B]